MTQLVLEANVSEVITRFSMFGVVREYPDERRVPLGQVEALTEALQELPVVRKLDLRGNDALTVQVLMGDWKL